MFVPSFLYKMTTKVAIYSTSISTISLKVFDAGSYFSLQKVIEEGPSGVEGITNDDVTKDYTWRATVIAGDGIKSSDPEW